MRTLLLFLFATLLGGCSPSPSDPIDCLASKFSEENVWEDGAYTLLSLPKAASPGQVIQKMFEVRGFSEKQIARSKIVSLREVYLPAGSANSYTAVLMRTDAGDRIFLFKYISPKLGWWSRVYEVKTLIY